MPAPVSVRIEGVDGGHHRGHLVDAVRAPGHAGELPPGSWRGYSVCVG
ncbi:hypothetical protein [Streptomyces sp. NPDC021224]